MGDINHVVLVGRLTRDAQLKTTNSGLAICNFSIAVNRSVKRNEKWEKEAHFFDITLFGKSGEGLSPYLLKGIQIAVDGELRQDRWEKDGQHYSKIAIIANDIMLLGSKNGGSNGSNGSKSEIDSHRDESNHEGQQHFEDDIPF